jgi:hypothetical protein
MTGFFVPLDSATSRGDVTAAYGRGVNIGDTDECCMQLPVLGSFTAEFRLRVESFSSAPASNS